LDNCPDAHDLRRVRALSSKIFVGWHVKQLVSGVGGREFPSSNFLQCLKLHILQHGLNPKPSQLAQANVMNLVTASHTENLITAMYFSIVGCIDHCHVIQ
jgi:hypothetical protein